MRINAHAGALLFLRHSNFFFFFVVLLLHDTYVRTYVRTPGAFWSVDLDTRAMFNIQLTASEQASILQRFSFAVEYL